jgi:HAD superfamily hydrolase (TIGR01509 family)
MAAYEAVLFDYGGVLTDGYDETGYFQELAKKFHSEEQELKDYLSKTKLLHQLSRGEIVEIDVVDSVLSALPGTIAIEPVEITSEHFRPDMRVLQAVADLRVRSVAKLAVISNLFPASKQILLDNGFENLFDRLFFSCDMGSRKPEDAYFEEVFTTLDIDPERALVIDDLEVNLEAARKFGATALYPGDGQSLIDFLQTLS